MKTFSYSVLKNKIEIQIERIATYLQARPTMMVLTSVGVVLAIMAYGTYVSLIVPGQQMRIIQEAYSASDYKKVIEVATRIVEKNPRNVEAALALATALIQQAILDGDLASVLPRVREILLVAEGFAPDNSEVQRQLGRVALLGDDFALAKGYLLKAVELDPENPDAHAYLCAYYDVTRQTPLAQEACATSLALDAYDPFALVTSAHIAIKTKDLRQARIYAESAVTYSDNPVVLSEAHTVAAFVAVEGFDLGLARDHVEKALGSNPKNFNALVLFGEIGMRSLAYDALSGKNVQENIDWEPMLKRAGQAMLVDSSNYYPYLLFMRAYEITGNTAMAAKHREIARRLVQADVRLSQEEVTAVIDRLDAAKNITIKSVRLIPEGSAGTQGAIRTYVIQP